MRLIQIKVQLTSIKMLAAFEKELLVEWFEHLSSAKQIYKEPLLANSILRLLKQITDYLKLSSYVFILSIEVSEAYVRIKDLRRQKIKEPLLTIVAITFICHKFEGGQEILKSSNIMQVLHHISRKIYNSAHLLRMEGEVLQTLAGSIPLTTPLNDLDIVVEHYMRVIKPKINMGPLCVKILEHVYLEKPNWFPQLKAYYETNQNFPMTFQTIMCSRFFIPACVFIASLNLSPYGSLLDVQAIIADMALQSQLNAEHIVYMLNRIVESLLV